MNKIEKILASLNILWVFLLLLMGVSPHLKAQQGDIIPTACATATYTLSPGSTIHFYDDGGPGGDCSTSGASGNFSNSGCETITTICPAPGEVLSVQFLVLSMFATSSGFDWMVIYEGPTTSGNILFDNRSGGPDNPYGTSCNFDTSTEFCAVDQCFTFRFYASSVVNREGWDAVVSSTSLPNTAYINIDPPTCTEDGVATILNYDINETYTFTPAGPTIDPSGEIDNVNFGQTYSLEIGVNSCIATTFQVEERLNQATITTPTDMCGAGDTQTLVGSPGGGTWSSSDPTIATIDAAGEVTSVGPGTTTITYDLSGCPQTVNLMVNSEVTPTFDPVPSFCETTTPPVLPTTSTNGIDGSWNPSTVSNTGGTTTYTFTPDGGCASTTTLDVFVEPTPVFTLLGTAPSACNLSDGQITIEGLNPNATYSVEYVDENGNNIGPITVNTDAVGEGIVNNLTNGTYTNFVVSIDGCIGTNAQTITLISPDIPTIDAGQDIVACEGDLIDLTANNPDGAQISWDNGVVDGVEFSPTLGTTTYTVTANLSGCIASDELDVTVNPVPVVDAGSDISVCTGEQITLSGNGNQNYIWDNNVVDGQPFTPPVGTTVYTASVTNSFGCVGEDFVTVFVSDVAEVEFTADVTSGCAPLTVEFSNNSSTPGSCKYTFSDGTELNGCDLTHTFTEPGCYDVTLELENNAGCFGTKTETNYICVDAVPQAGFTVDSDVVTDFYREVEFTNTSHNAETYIWSFGDETISSETNPNHEYELEENKYTVTLTAISELGCIDTTSMVIYVEEELVYYIPNTFTPDGNEINQTFQPIFDSGFDPQDYRLLIFNRWGEKVFESYDASFGWDGTYGLNGHGKVKEGTYVYKINFKRDKNEDKIEIVGHVNIIR